MDYKPRRSESEAPHGTYTAGKAVQPMTNPDGTTRPAGHTVSILSRCPAFAVSLMVPFSHG